MTVRSEILPSWCPGCSNFVILNAFDSVIDELSRDGKIDVRKMIVNSGIGCHGKIFDYLNISGVNALHGRSIPLSLGIKLANKDLKVVCFVGDGDMYAEGLEHLIHASRYNIDVKVFVHNNGTFALTTGQSAPTSKKGFKSKVRPEGERVEPLDPILLLLASNASFVARAYALDQESLKQIFKEALLHKGFAVVDILQPCVSFNDFRNEVRDRLMKIENPLKSREEAISFHFQSIKDGKIPIGVYFKEEKKTFEEVEQIEKVYSRLKRKIDLEKLIEDFVIQ